MVFNLRNYRSVIRNHLMSSKIYIQFLGEFCIRKFCNILQYFVTFHQCRKFVDFAIFMFFMKTKDLYTIAKSTKLRKLRNGAKYSFAIMKLLRSFHIRGYTVSGVWNRYYYRGSFPKYPTWFRASTYPWKIQLWHI